MLHDFTQYQKTGCYAIDMCANLIACARVNRQAVKSLTLKPIMYEWFKSGTQQMMGKPLEDGQQMQLDGVDIEKGTIYQIKDVLIEYYQQVKAQA